MEGVRPYRYYVNGKLNFLKLTPTAFSTHERRNIFIGICIILVAGCIGTKKTSANI